MCQLENDTKLKIITINEDKLARTEATVYDSNDPLNNVPTNNDNSKNDTTEVDQTMNTGSLVLDESLDNQLLNDNECDDNQSTLTSDSNLDISSDNNNFSNENVNTFTNSYYSYYNRPDLI